MILHVPRTRPLVLAALCALLILTAMTAQRVAAGSSHDMVGWKVVHLHEVDTAVAPVDNPPTGTSAGDTLVFVARVTSGGHLVGRDVGNCAYVTRTEIFCSIDMNVYGKGRVEFAGELSTVNADSVFPITGGSGQFALARGYLVNHQNSTGSSADQVVHVYLP